MGVQSVPLEISDANSKISDKSHKEIVLAPFDYVKNLPSKHIRRKIAEVFNYWFNDCKEDLDFTSEIMDILHNASLIVDDIEDGSDLRRGQPACHIVFGVPQALNAANYMYFDVFERILHNERNSFEVRFKILTILNKGMITLHLGQGMELYWRDENIKAKDSSFVHVPTEQEYLDIIVKKTSEQFVLLGEILNLTCEKEIDLSTFANLLGNHFQIRDDLMNLVSLSYEDGKGFCEDITEGKFSFPIIYALNRKAKVGGIGDKKANRLLEILRMQTHERILKEEALEIIKKSGALEYCEERLKELNDQIIKEVDKLGGNPIFSIYFAVFSNNF